MRDFTIDKYFTLLRTLQKSGYSFQTCEQFLTLPNEKVVILRHHVDKKSSYSLKTAFIEQDLDINGSYYFRVVPDSNNADIIKQIADLGHEIGYHYEDLRICNGDIDEAFENFEINLAYFRLFYPVKTICMHGHPKSRLNSRKLWKKYSYKNLGIIGDPFFDIDFSKVLYLTDADRKWDSDKVSVQDIPIYNSQLNLEFCKSTNDIIKAAIDGRLPNQIMITIHPERWTDNPLKWLKILWKQKIKKLLKSLRKQPKDLDINLIN